MNKFKTIQGGLSFWVEVTTAVRKSRIFSLKAQDQ